MRVHGRVLVAEARRAERNARCEPLELKIVVFTIIREWGNISNQLLCLSNYLSITS